MIVFGLKLLIAHIIGDFVLQPDKWVKDKKKKKYKSKYFYLHGLIHFLALSFVLFFNLDYTIEIICIVVSHLLIDLLKLTLENKKNSRKLFAIDQALHIIILGIIIYINYPTSIPIYQLLSKEILLSILAILMLTSVSSVIIKTMMSKWQLDSNQPKNTLENAGAYIGVLERLFIFIFIVLDQWAAIGFLITAKSVFRFGDISRAKDRKLTEYILIGTLISFILAVFIGLGYTYLLLL